MGILKEHLRVNHKDDGTVDFGATRQASEQALREDLHTSLVMHFDAIEEQQVALILEKGRFTESDLVKFYDNEEVWKKPYLGYEFNGILDLLTDAEKFPIDFTTEDIILTFGNHFRSSDVNQHLKLYPQYASRLSPYARFYLAVQGILPDDYQEFFDVGLTDVNHIVQASKTYDLTPQNIADFDAKFSPHQIFRFIKGHISNKLAVQLTRKQIAIVMGENVMPTLLQTDANKNGRGEYEPKTDETINITTRVLNRVILTYKRRI